MTHFLHTVGIVSYLVSIGLCQIICISGSTDIKKPRLEWLSVPANRKSWGKSGISFVLASVDTDIHGDFHTVDTQALFCQCWEEQQKNMACTV